MDKYYKYLNNRNLSTNTIKIYIHWKEAFQKYCNQKITLDKFSRFLKNYEMRHSANSTRLVFSSIINYLKFIKSPIIEKAKEYKLPKVQEFPKKILSIELLLKLINNLSKNFFNNRLIIWVKLLIYTGIRANELLTLSKKNLIDNNKLIIRGKGNKTRIVFINEELLNLLLKWPFDEFVVNKKGKKITSKQLRLIIRNFGKKNNIRIHPHMIRRTFCTELIKKGCSLKTVQKLMGHSNIAVTSRYIEISEEEMFQEYSKVF